MKQDRESSENQDAARVSAFATQDGSVHVICKWQKNAIEKLEFLRQKIASVMPSFNLVPLDKTEDIIYAQLAHEIGSLVLDFDNFRYFTFQTSQKLSNYPAGNSGFNLPKNQCVAVVCLLKNLDPRKRTIVLDSHSLFWQPGRSGVAETGWFIVNVAPDGIIQSSYSSITIRYGETVSSVFASQNDIGTGSFSRLKTPNAVTTVATFLLLHGTIEGQPFVHNIPYVSVFHN